MEGFQIFYHQRGSGGSAPSQKEYIIERDATATICIFSNRFICSFSDGHTFYESSLSSTCQTPLAYEKICFIYLKNLFIFFFLASSKATKSSFSSIQVVTTRIKQLHCILKEIPDLIPLWLRGSKRLLKDDDYNHTLKFYTRDSH